MFKKNLKQKSDELKSQTEQFFIQDEYLLNLSEYLSIILKKNEF
jgi:hypothetical protein